MERLHAVVDVVTIDVVVGGILHLPHTRPVVCRTSHVTVVASEVGVENHECGIHRFILCSISQRCPYLLFAEDEPLCVLRLSSQVLSEHGRCAVVSVVIGSVGNCVGIDWLSFLVIQISIRLFHTCDGERYRISVIHVIAIEVISTFVAYLSLHLVSAILILNEGYIFRMLDQRSTCTPVIASTPEEVRSRVEQIVLAICEVHRFWSWFNLLLVRSSSRFVGIAHTGECPSTDWAVVAWQSFSLRQTDGHRSAILKDVEEEFVAVVASDIPFASVYSRVWYVFAVVELHILTAHIHVGSTFRDIHHLLGVLVLLSGVVGIERKFFLEFSTCGNLRLLVVERTCPIECIDGEFVETSWHVFKGLAHFERRIAIGSDEVHRSLIRTRLECVLRVGPVLISVLQISRVLDELGHILRSHRLSPFCDGPNAMVGCRLVCPNLRAGSCVVEAEQTFGALDGVLTVSHHVEVEHVCFSHVFCRSDSPVVICGLEDEGFNLSLILLLHLAADGPSAIHFGEIDSGILLNHHFALDHAEVAFSGLVSHSVRLSCNRFVELHTCHSCIDFFLRLSHFDSSLSLEDRRLVIEEEVVAGWQLLEFFSSLFLGDFEHDLVCHFLRNLIEFESVEV